MTGGKTLCQQNTNSISRSNSISSSDTEVLSGIMEVEKLGCKLPTYTCSGSKRLSRSLFKPVRLLTKPIELPAKYNRDGDRLVQRDRFPGKDIYGRVDLKLQKERIDSDTLRTRADFILAQKMSRTPSQPSSSNSISSVHTPLRDITANQGQRYADKLRPLSVLDQENLPSSDRDNVKTAASHCEPSVYVEKWMRSVNKQPPIRTSQTGSSKQENFDKAFPKRTVSVRPLEKSLEVIGISLPHTMVLMQYLRDGEKPSLTSTSPSKSICQERRSVDTNNVTNIDRLTNNERKKQSLVNAPDSAIIPLDQITGSDQADRKVHSHCATTQVNTTRYSKFDHLMHRLSEARGLDSKQSKKRHSLTVSGAIASDDLREATADALPIKILSFPPEPLTSASPRPRQVCQLKIPACFTDF